MKCARSPERLAPGSSCDWSSSEKSRGNPNLVVGTLKLCFSQSLTNSIFITRLFKMKILHSAHKQRCPKGPKGEHVSHM